MTDKNNSGLEEYNGFCSELRAGNILYNVNSMSCWGEYLLVANVTHVRIGENDTYTVLLLGLRKQDGNYIPTNNCISLTPDNMNHIPFLKHVGYCKFRLTPVFEDIKIDVGLAAVYSQTDLHKFVTKLSIRKPRRRKYGKDGKPVIKKNGN